MADQKNNTVEDIERVEVVPTDDDELVEDPREEKETPSTVSGENKPAKDDSEESEENVESSEETESEENQDKPDELRGRSLNVEKKPETKREPAPVAGETPRERALRLEVQRLKEDRRNERAKDLIGDSKPQTTQKELSPEDLEVLKGFDQEELQNLERAVSVMAKKNGWVSEGQLSQQTYQQTAEGELQGFLDAHPEYAPENDKDNVLWNRFKEEYNLYKHPNNPRDYRKIFTKIHSEVFGSTTGNDLEKIEARQEKIKVGSHAGNASAKGGNAVSSASHIDPSLLEHLKGFSDEEKKELLQ